MSFFQLFRQKADERGQIAVIVLLIMAVLLVIGISLASRTSEEIAISTQQQETTRVFNAAEAGIEEALSTDFGLDAIGGSAPEGELQIDDIDVKYRVIANEGVDGVDLSPGQTLTVVMSQTGAPRIEWRGTGNCSTAPPLILTAYYTDGAQVRAIHEAVRTSTNTNAGTFTEVSCSSNVATFNFTGIPTGSRHFLRVTPLYNQATIVRIDGVAGQSQTIRSEARRENTFGDTEFRAIEVTRTNPAPPSIFDYALYSGGSLTKN